MIYLKLNLTTLDVDVLDNMKKSAIRDYKKFVINLQKGYRQDYQHILSKINFIEIYKNLDNRSFIYEYLINN